MNVHTRLERLKEMVWGRMTESRLSFARKLQCPFHSGSSSLKVTIPRITTVLSSFSFEIGKDTIRYFGSVHFTLRLCGRLHWWRISKTTSGWKNQAEFCIFKNPYWKGCFSLVKGLRAGVVCDPLRGLFMEIFPGLSSDPLWCPSTKRNPM